MFKIYSENEDKTPVHYLRLAEDEEGAIRLDVVDAGGRPIGTILSLPNGMLHRWEWERGCNAPFKISEDCRIKILGAADANVSVYG